MEPTSRPAFPGRRPRGRPKAATPRAGYVKVYCTPHEKARIAQRAADASFNSVSDYLRSGGLRGWVRRVKLALTLDRHLGPLQALVHWAEAEGRTDLAKPARESIAHVRQIIKSL
jgi:hypothetical protein